MLSLFIYVHFIEDIKWYSFLMSRCGKVKNCIRCLVDYFYASIVMIDRLGSVPFTTHTKMSIWHGWVHADPREQHAKNVSKSIQ